MRLTEPVRAVLAGALLAVLAGGAAVGLHAARAAHGAPVAAGLAVPPRVPPPPPGAAHASARTTRTAGAPPAPAGVDVVSVGDGQVAALPPHDRQATDVAFTGPAHGWLAAPCATAANPGACSDIWATADGGRTWVKQYAGTSVADLQFVDPQHGFALGGAGCNAAQEPCRRYLVATADGGLRWTVTALPSRSLSALHFVGLDTAWGLDQGALVQSTDGGLQWSPALATPACRFEALSFPTAPDGWASGGGPGGPCLYRTTDGGRTWRPSFSGAQAVPVRAALQTYARAAGMTRVTRHLDAVLQGCSARQVAFPGPATGWLVVDCIRFNPGALAVLRTTDGGRTWSFAWGTGGCAMGCQSMGGSLAPLFFLDGSVVWRAAPYGAAHSVDAGRAWRAGSRLCPIAQCFVHLFFLDRDRGWAAAPDGLFATRNGGATWSRLWPSTGPGPLAAVSFVGPQRGWAVARLSPRTLLETSDGGRTWRVASRAPGPAALTGIEFLNRRTGWAWSAGAPVVLLRTVNGGASWQPLAVPPGRFGQPRTQIRAADFVNRDDGWLLGGFGSLYRTLDGGVSWTHLAPLPGGAVLHIRFVGTHRGYGVAFRKVAGTVPLHGGYRLLTTHDGGARWRIVARWPWRPQGFQFLAAVFSFPGVSHGWLFAEQGLLRTRDGGRTWAEYRLRGVQPQSLQFVDPVRGWLLTAGGRLFRSTDGGRTWRQVDPTLAGRGTRP